ncbi:MAG: MBL fold metallo-hydrolase [Actinomycetota bacterium]|nr:MBL fold metallo-hydrolase [Actinomycetota bacterium]
MLVAGFPAGSWGTNCYVVAPAAGEQCVVIDPGQDAADGVAELIREHRLSPVAVLLTHGHIDHIWSVVPVCGASDVPAFIHPADRDLLSDPGKGLGMDVGSMFGGLTFTEPDDVRELTEDGPLELAGLRFSVDLSPGHTPGSICFRLPAIEAGEVTVPLMFSGDLLFAGSIGRTDLPGGSYPTILQSLARVCLPLPDETAVLSGHGPATTIGRERASNPYLREAAESAGAAVPPARGL